MAETVKLADEATADLPEGFKITELGPLPEDWQVVPLAMVAVIGGSKVNLSPYEPIPFIPMSLIPEDLLYITNWELRMRKDVRSGIPVREGDLLLAKITPCLENGKQGIVKGLPNGWGYASTEVYPIRTLDSLDIEFLALYLKHEKVRHMLASKMEGTTGRQRLPKAVLEAFPIPLPPVHEQRIIASVLRTVQRAKEATEKVLAAVRELKTSLMKHLFTYGPVPVEEAERVPLKETEIGPMPEHWQLARMADLFNIQQGKAVSPKHRKGQRAMPFLRTANVHWCRIDVSLLDYMDFDEDEIERLALRHGDLLVCEGGDIGRTAMWEGQLPLCLYQNHLHRLRAKRSDVEPAFFMYWMQTAWTLLKVYSGTGNKTTIPNLSRSRLASFAVPFPPLHEQREIARILHAVDQKIAAEEQRKAALDVLFKTLLHLLMTGRIRVKELPLSQAEGVSLSASRE